MPLSDLVVRQAKAADKNRTLLDYDIYSLPLQGHKAWHFRYTRALLEWLRLNFP